ncbi:protein RAE1 [Senna tora]|uniref:Protein RAE1 n=1 Tax=Senna tora TaxID=362788 RepID=A0A834WIZ8_9FABA|nr:protein RAE1 [Senna tora]
MSGGEFGNVVDEDQVGVEVDDFADTWREEVGEVIAGIVQRVRRKEGTERGFKEKRNFLVILSLGLVNGNFLVHHTFATSGSDGAFNFWDKDSKQRLKAMLRCSQPIPCSTFNNDGSIFAYSVHFISVQVCSSVLVFSSY